MVVMDFVLFSVVMMVISGIWGYIEVDKWGNVR